MLMRVPEIIKNILSLDLIWSLPDKEQSVYLTFDDGPHPLVTPEILEILKHYNVKATFFSMGINVDKYPYIFEKIKKEGHLVGNHTYNHLSYLKVKKREYVKDILEADRIIKSIFFRPPYGIISPSMVRLLSKRFKIVMWSVNSLDYSSSMSKEKCLANVIKYTENGSIVLFHDNEKSKDKISYVLPHYIEFLLSSGFRLKLLNKEA